ncbi:hypothetical protein [Nitrospira sp. Ecomares 2.1]
MTEQQNSDDSPLVTMMRSDWDETLQKQAMKAGACLVLKKTYDLQQLVAQVMKVLG